MQVKLDGDPMGDWTHDVDLPNRIRATELIINVALTGCVHSVGANPHLPITRGQIAADARRCAEQGASIFHLHARDADGLPTMHEGVYQGVVDVVREAVPGVIVCVSCSGRHTQGFIHPTGGLRIQPTPPEMASLSLGSYNSFGSVITNPPELIQLLAERMQKWEIMPELEVFELGHIAYAHYLITKGVLQPPYWFNLFLGNRGTAPALRGVLNWMVGLLPRTALWAGAGIGHFQYQINQWAIENGGQVRVGLEDNLWMDNDKRDPATNPRQVERIVGYAWEWGREPVSIERAREILGMEAA